MLLCITLQFSDLLAQRVHDPWQVTKMDPGCDVRAAVINTDLWIPNRQAMHSPDKKFNTMRIDHLMVATKVDFSGMFQSQMFTAGCESYKVRSLTFNVVSLAHAEKTKCYSNLACCPGEYHAPVERTIGEMMLLCLA